MAFSLGILLAILGAAGLCVLTWRGVQSSAIITNPFSELPDDAFQKCAAMVKKRYTFFFICCLVILISLILIYTAAAGAGGNIYLLGIFGIFLGLFFYALGIFERRKVEEMLEAYKHNWKDLTQSIAVHKV
jgi:hypothetical protein